MDLSECNFKVGDLVVYPAHGVGEITAEEVSSVSMPMPVYVVTFHDKNMILRVPKARAAKNGLRHLSSSASLDQALSILSGKPIKANKTMWNKRVQQYEVKLNSGNVIFIAEVIKELHVGADGSEKERSYSEKLIYADALDRLAKEYAAMCKVPLEEALHTINTQLNSSLYGFTD